VPVVATATALPLDREPGLPPPWLGWRPATDAAGLARIDAAWRIVDRLMRPIESAVDDAFRAQAVRRPAACRGWGDAGAAPGGACRPPRATLAQAIAGADFPRAAPPPGFACCGPWRGPLRSDATIDRLLDDADRPLAFVSLGTLQGSRGRLFAAIAGACSDLGLRAVVAHGGRLDPREAASLPGAPLVFDFVPQRAVLARCALAITHCGFNTVLDALEAGLPIVALPLAFEQPGTAARLAHAGVAEVLSPPAAVTRARLRGAIARALGGAHRMRARALAAEVAAAGGAPAAADRIEAVLRAAGREQAATGASVA
jgi:zeaxanthin glucosyltransferase